jgi:hypothetical protein
VPGNVFRSWLHKWLVTGKLTGPFRLQFLRWLLFEFVRQARAGVRRRVAAAYGEGIRLGLEFDVERDAGCGLRASSTGCGLRVA